MAAVILRLDRRIHSYNETGFCGGRSGFSRELYSLPVISKKRSSLSFSLNHPPSHVISEELLINAPPAISKKLRSDD